MNLIQHTLLLNDIAVNTPSFGQWGWALFGLFVYEVAFFVMATDELDGTRKRFKYKKYAQDNWPNWLFALVCVPIIVFFGEQVWYYVTKYFGFEAHFMDVLFLTSGVFSDLMFVGLKKMKIVYKALKDNSNNK